MATDLALQSTTTNNQGGSEGNAIVVSPNSSPDCAILPAHGAGITGPKSGADKPLSGAMSPNTPGSSSAGRTPRVDGGNNNHSVLGSLYGFEGRFISGKKIATPSTGRRRLLELQQRRAGQKRLASYGTTWTEDPEDLTDNENNTKSWEEWMMKVLMPQILVTGAVLSFLVLLQGGQVALTGVVHRVREGRNCRSIPVKTEAGPLGSGVGQSREGGAEDEPLLQPRVEHGRYFHQRRRIIYNGREDIEEDVHTEEPETDSVISHMNFWQRDFRAEIDVRNRVRFTVLAFNRALEMPEDLTRMITSYLPQDRQTLFENYMNGLGLTPDGEELPYDTEDSEGWEVNSEYEPNPEASSSTTPYTLGLSGVNRAEPGTAACENHEQERRTGDPNDSEGDDCDGRIALQWIHRWPETVGPCPWSREIKRWDLGGRPMRRPERDRYRQSLQSMGIVVVPTEAALHHASCWVQAILSATPGITGQQLERLAGYNYPQAIGHEELGAIIDELGLDLTVMLMYYAWTDRSDVQHGADGIPEGPFHVTQAECLRRARQFRGAGLFATTRAGTVGSRIIVLCMAPNGPIGHYVALGNDGLNLYNTPMPPGLVPQRQFASAYATLVDQVVEPETGDVIGFRERGAGDGEEHGDQCGCCLERVNRHRVECRVCHSAWHVWCYQQLLATQPQFRHSFRSDLAVCVNCRARSAVVSHPMQPPPPPPEGGPWGGPDREAYPHPEGDEPGASTQLEAMEPIAVAENPAPVVAAGPAAARAGPTPDEPRDSDEHLNLLVQREIRRVVPPGPGESLIRPENPFRVVIVTPQYIESMTCCFQVLISGGDADAQDGRQRLGPHCTCMTTVSYQMLGICTHLIRGLWNGEVWIHGSQDSGWVEALYGRTSRVKRMMLVNGRLTLRARPELRTGIIVPQLATVTPGSTQVEVPHGRYPMAARFRTAVGSIPIAYQAWRDPDRPHDSILTWQPRLSLLDSWAVCLARISEPLFFPRIIGGVVMGAIAHYGGLLTTFGLKLLAAFATTHVAPAIAAAVAAIIGANPITVGILAFAGLLALKGYATATIVQFLARFEASHMLGFVLTAGWWDLVALAYAVARPAQFLPSLESEHDILAEPGVLTELGSEGMTTALRARATARDCFWDPALMSALVSSTAARLDHPTTMTTQAVRLAVQPRGQSTIRGPLGAGNQRKQCVACGENARARAGRNGKGKTYELCGTCLRALPKTRGSYSYDPRYACILGDLLPVNEHTPLLPIYSVARREPTVDREENWEKKYRFKTTFQPQKHGAEVDEKNHVRRGVMPGVYHPSWPAGVVPRGPHSMYRALITRTYRQVPEVDPDNWRSADFVARRLVPSSADGTVHRLSDADWLMNQERAEDMLAAIHQLAREGMLDDDWVCKPFVKSEWNLDAEPQGGGSGEKKTVKPRAIYTLSDKTHTKVGPYTLPLGAAWKRIFPLDGMITYAGGLKPEAMRELLAEMRVKYEGGWQYWDNDYTCFETCKSAQSFKAYRDVARRLWSTHDEDRERFMDAWESPQFKAYSGGHRFSGKLPTMTCSGRSDTTAENSWTNALITYMGIVSALSGYPVRELDQVPAWIWAWTETGVRIVVSGDDSVIFLAPSFAGANTGGQWLKDRFQKAVGELGFQPKLERRMDFCDVVFLGHRPYWAEGPDGTGAYEWGPTLGRRMYKHHCMLDPTVNPRDWLGEISRFEAHAYKHVPVLGDLAVVTNNLLGITRPLTEKAMKKIRKGREYGTAIFQGDHRNLPHYTERTVGELAQVYNVTSELIWDCIEQVRSIPCLPYAFSHPFIDVIMKADN